MSSTTTPANTPSRNLIVEVQNDNTQIIVRSINIQTLKVKKQTIPCYFSNKIQRECLFQKLETILNLKKVKAIGFVNIDAPFEKLSDGLEYRYKCRDFCKENGIFMLFLNLFNTLALSAVTKTSTMVNEGENVLVVFFNPSACKINALRLNREKDRYRMKDAKASDYPVLSEQWKEDMMESFVPKKTIFLLDQSFKNFHNKDLKSLTAFFKPSAIIERTTELMDQSTVDNMLHVMGEKVNPYYVVYETNCQYNVLVGKQAYIHTSGVVPCEFSNMTVVDPTKSVSLYMDFLPYKPKELVKEIELSNFNTKMVLFTLNLDINSFFELKVEPIPDEMLPQFNISAKGTPKICMKEKARIVFGKQYFSVFFVGNIKDVVETDSDHLEKTPIYIAFHETKPVIGRKAKELLNTKPNFVVFDLIKLASVSNADIENPKWSFRLNKEDETLMLTAQTLDGDKKFPIEFLLAILLKDGIKRVFKTCNEKVEDLQIKFDDELTPNEILKSNIVKAGKLLKVNIIFA